MFGFLGDIVKGVGSVTGSIIGLPLNAVAFSLGITESMVRDAKKSGCKTYEDIKRFYDL